MMEIGSEAFRKADKRFVAAVLADAADCLQPSHAEPSRAEPRGCGVTEATLTAPADAVRAVRPIALGGVDVGSADTPPPEFEWVTPGDLMVDVSYQRNLSERSARLIRRICAGWDWRRFKPPVCARTDRGLEVIDGQHTAIAACTHPDVDRIPVMVVTAAERSDRAQAFIGQNRDRLNITPMQLHYAAAAAGDDLAQTINQVCERAGVRVLKATPGNGVWKVGDTVAVVAIGALINRRGAMRARIVLECLAKGRAQPVSAGQIKAVELLLHSDEYREEIDADGVVNALLALGAQADQDAAVFAATHRIPVWKALAIVLFKKGKRRARRRAD